MQKNMYDLTNPQKSIWYTEEFFKGTPIENITGSVIIPEKVNFSLLAEAINIFVSKSDSFRLKFFIEKNQVKQYVETYTKFDVEIIDVLSDDELRNVEKTIVSTAFDILNSFLFNFKLVKFPDNHGGFIINMHHLISDAWSAGLGASEIIKIYTRLVKKEPIDDITYPSYIDYITSEEKYLQSDKYNKDKLFWNEMFQTVPEIASIPSIGYFTKNNIAGKSIRKQFILPNDLIQKINDFCKTNKFSAFNFFMAIFSIYIGRTSNLDEFVIGSPILNRGNVKEKHTSGMFISTVPLKVNIGNDISFSGLASNISSNFFSIFKHQKYPYLSLLEDLRHIDSTIPNLYNTLISYQNIRSTAQSSETPYDINWIPNNFTSDSLDIHIYDMNDTGNMNIAYDYQIVKYSDQDIENIHKRILFMIEQVFENADILVKDLDIITPDEKNRILNDFNNQKLEYDTTQNIKEVFEAQAQKAPNDIAVVFDNDALSYKELNEKANSLSHYLMKHDIKKGDIVPVLMNRSTDLIVSMLAIIKCGAIYLPISIEYPTERIEYILENCNAKLFITTKTNNLISNDKFEKIFLDDFKYSSNSIKNPEVQISSNDVLYIIYTSGSTGNPKGVKVTNQNLHNFVANFTNYFDGVDASDNCLASTNMAFDVSIFEYFTTLLNGATLYLYEENTINDIFKYCRSIVRNNITLLYIPPNILEEVYAILSTYSFVPIKKILIGVEPIGSATMKKYYKFNKNMKIINAYGPTETTICATANILDEATIKNYRVIPIGKPLGNLRLFILDKYLKPMPIYTPGELYITGDGVGKGYLNNKELTEKSFIKLPDELSSKIAYKTGDLAKWNDDGTISFIGRKDNQVKINGHRIELGEIESCIYRYPNVEKCVVTIDNNQKIIAYFSSEKPVNIADLKAFMQRKLPTYFIPNFFVPVEKFKLTANGKVDRKALAKIKINTETTYEPPKTEYQKQLAEIFETVLGISKISITDNFFEIGGDSLSAIKLQIEAFNKGLDISYKDIFNYPTIKLLAENTSKSTDEAQPEPEEVYDYSSIDELIEKNVNPNKAKMKKDKVKNILLTGATGYMGSHILDSLLKHTKSNIYCLVRAKNNNDPQTRLLDILKFYFGNKYDKLIFKRIFAVEGDVTDAKLGLNDLYYEELGQSIDCVINSAAVVKHYGNSSVFNDTNIVGTQNLINFCLKFNCKLMHLSTLSVSGNIFDKKLEVQPSEVVSFTEKNLYINQDLSNIYIKTKFLAERLILENIIKNNLNAKIIRLGNITNRYSDGAFQINVSENAFLNRIHSFIQIGYVPESLRNYPIEFSPVDLCALAIVNLTIYQNPFTIFHVFNQNYITFEQLIKVFNTLHVKLDFIDDKLFSQKVEELSNNPETKHIISGIINDFSRDKHIKYVSNIVLSNSFTNNYLRRILFRWPKINEKYLSKYVVYLKTIGYIKF